MKRFELSRYIKKWLPLIILVCAGLTAAIYLFLSKSQAYIASAVIEYKSVGADEGKTPLGTELDVNAIKSSAIVSKAIGNLKLDSRSYSVDKLISSIKITEVIDEDEEARKEAVLEDGEEYVYKPTKYIVSFELIIMKMRILLEECLMRSWICIFQISVKSMSTSALPQTLSALFMKEIMIILR